MRKERMNFSGDDAIENDFDLEWLIGVIIVFAFFGAIIAAGVWFG